MRNLQIKYFSQLHLIEDQISGVCCSGSEKQHTNGTCWN